MTSLIHTATALEVSKYICLIILDSLQDIYVRAIFVQLIEQFN